MSRILELASSAVKNLPGDLPEEMLDFWIGKPGELQRFLLGLRQKPCPKWRKENGVIYFDATFDGMSGPDWIPRLEKNGKRIGDYARSILLSPDFKPTNVGTSNVAVLPGEFFADNNRVTEKIRAEAELRKWGKTNADLACVIREMFTDEEIKDMGLWAIIAMHELIVDSGGSPRLLGTCRDVGGGWLFAYCGRPGLRWLRADGFAFVSQVSCA